MLNNHNHFSVQAMRATAVLRMNCAYNAIFALTRAQYGRMVAFPAVRCLMDRVVSETVAVARAEGVPLSAPAMTEAVYRLAGRRGCDANSVSQTPGRFYAFGRRPDSRGFANWRPHRGVLKA